MNCRSFHKKLEDYLEGGLDFPARFGIERHAQHCFACGKDLDAAQKLGEMSRRLPRVTAPPDFETTVMSRIHAKSPAYGWYRNLWFYGLDWPQLRVYLVGTASLIVLLGIAVVLSLNESPFHNAAGNPTPQNLGVSPLASKDRSTAEADPFPNDPFPYPFGAEALEDFGGQKLPFDEVLVTAPDGRVIMVLPDTILQKRDQRSDEYFVQNISH